MMEFFFPFILTVAAILISPLIFHRFGLPRAVSILLAGIFLGPYGTDIMNYVVTATGGKPENINFMFDSMGVLGAIFLMSLAGMEISPRLIKKEWQAIAVFASLSTTLPGIVGYTMARRIGLDSISSLFVASLFASHSVALVFATLKHFKVVGTRLGIILLESTLITDIIALVAMSVAVQLKAQQGLSFTDNPFYIITYAHISLEPYQLVLFSLTTTLVFIFASVYLVKVISDRILVSMPVHDPRRITTLILLILLVALAGEVIGIHVIIGAFIAGLAVADSIGVREEESTLHKKMDSVGYGIFIPFFFFNLGMHTNIRAVFSVPSYALLIVAMGAALIATKIISGYISLRIIGFDGRTSFVGSWLTIPQLSATLAAAQVGRIGGLIPENVFTAIIVISIVTTLMRPLGSRMLIRLFEVEFARVEPEMEDLVYIIEEQEVEREEIPIYEEEEYVVTTEPSPEDEEKYIEDHEAVAEDYFEEETID